MRDYIPISILNDYVFCPYSVYLHNVYKDTDESMYHATPQVKGRTAHKAIDTKAVHKVSTDLIAISVVSDELGVYGKIDIFYREKGLLVERKYQISQIFRGQLYQLWSQYYSLLEMGYNVSSLAFYETSKNKMHQVALPTMLEKNELIDFIEQYKRYDPLGPLRINVNKCRHCIYCNLCDKTDVANVYE